jgi:hypothetical protein
MGSRVDVVQTRHRRSLAGSLKDKVRRRPIDESWEALRRAAWESSDPDDRDQRRHGVATREH